MFALDCDIYRGTQACLWSGLLRTFLPRHISWSLTVIYQETYAWLSSDFNSEIFLHHIIRKRENKLCQSPACRHHVLLSNFHDTVRCNSWNIKKKNIKILWMIWWNYLTPVSEPQHVQATIWVFAEEMEFNLIYLW